MYVLPQNCRSVVQENRACECVDGVLDSCKTVGVQFTEELVYTMAWQFQTPAKLQECSSQLDEEEEYPLGFRLLQNCRSVVPLNNQIIQRFKNNNYTKSTKLMFQQVKTSSEKKEKSNRNPFMLFIFLKTFKLSGKKYIPVLFSDLHNLFRVSGSILVKQPVD